MHVTFMYCKPGLWNWCYVSFLSRRRVWKLAGAVPERLHVIKRCKFVKQTCRIIRFLYWCLVKISTMLVVWYDQLRFMLAKTIIESIVTFVLFCWLASLAVASEYVTFYNTRTSVSGFHCFPSGERLARRSGRHAAASCHARSNETQRVATPTACAAKVITVCTGTLLRTKHIIGRELFNFVMLRFIM